MSDFETVWTFETAKFSVTFDVAPEDMDPADSFQFEDDIEAVRSGAVAWFCARVAVRLKSTGAILGSDILGACAYESTDDFRESHFKSPAESRNTLALKAQNIHMCDYFPSMVREAIGEARRVAGQLHSLRAA